MKKKFYYSKPEGWVMFLDESSDNSSSTPAFIWDYVKVLNTDTKVIANHEYPISEIAYLELIFDGVYRDNVNGWGQVSVYKAVEQDGQWVKGELVNVQNESCLINTAPLVLQRFLKDMAQNYFVLPYKSSSGPVINYYYLNDDDEPCYWNTIKLTKIGDYFKEDNSLARPSCDSWLIKNKYYKSTSTSSEGITDQELIPDTTKITDFTTYAFFDREPILQTVTMLQSGDPAKMQLYYNNTLVNVEMPYSEIVSEELIYIKLGVLPYDASYSEENVQWCTTGYGHTGSDYECVSVQFFWQLQQKKEANFIVFCDVDDRFTPKKIKLFSKNEETDAIVYEKEYTFGEYDNEVNCWKASFITPNEPVTLELYIN